jgi:hypothetical protein
MASQYSATAHEETPHVIESNQNTISNALRRRAQSVINDKWIDAESRAMVRYALEINDPWLPELVRRVDAGETVVDIDFSRTPQNEDELDGERLEALTRLICRAGDEPGTKLAALLVLMATLENATHPKALANTVKHLAFNRCSDLNLYGMVDAQLPVLESELFAEQL